MLETIKAKILTKKSVQHEPENLFTMGREPTLQFLSQLCIATDSDISCDSMTNVSEHTDIKVEPISIRDEEQVLCSDSTGIMSGDCDTVLSPDVLSLGALSRSGSSI